jgi:hypothetical protein
MSCTTSATLKDCFPAPDFQGIDAWLNTPGGAPLTIKSLRGKVVLVDFWTGPDHACVARSDPFSCSWILTVSFTFTRAGLAIHRADG